jgi:hypothetical protein
MAAQVNVEVENKDRKRLWAGLLGAAAVTGGGVALAQLRILRNQAKLLAKQERSNALKKAILKKEDDKILQRAAKTEAEAKKAKSKNEGFKNWERGKTTPRPTPQAQHARGKKRKIGRTPPKSGRVETEASGHFRSEESNWRNPELHPNKDVVKLDPTVEEKVIIARKAHEEMLAKKKKPTGLSRLVKLIELDTLNVTRDKSGQFSGSGAPMTDPASMQAAYLLPRMNGSSPVMQAPRGRGRPPGSLNKSTVMRQEAAQNAAAEEIVAEAGSQQPEFQEEVMARQQRRESSIGKKAFIAAGLAAGGALVMGPRIAKGIGQARAEQKGTARILGKLGTELKPSSHPKSPYRGMKARPEIQVNRDKHGNAFFTYKKNPANNDPVLGKPVFGARLATKSVEKEIPIETLARDRVRGIREAIQRGKDKAAEWDRKNKGKRMPYENPYRRNEANYEARQAAGVPEPQVPPSPAERRTRTRAQDRRADKETAARWQAEAQATRASKDLTAAELKNKQDAKKAQDEARKQRDKIGSMSDEMKKLQEAADQGLKRKPGETDKAWAKRRLAAQEITMAKEGYSQKKKEAEAVLDMIHGKKPMSKQFVKTLQENPELKSQYTARVGPEDVRTVRQQDLFDVRNTATASSTGSYPKIVAEEAVEREKKKLLEPLLIGDKAITEGKEIFRTQVSDLAERHGLDEEALAEVIARRRVQGRTARIVPSLPPISKHAVKGPTGIRPPATSKEREAHAAMIRTRDKVLLKPDRELHASAKDYENKAWEIRRKEIRKKEAQGVILSKEEIRNAEKETRAEAQRAWARQKQAEGKLGDIRGIPVGSKKYHHRDIAYARADTRLIIRLSSALKRVELAAG